MQKTRFFSLMAACLGLLGLGVMSVGAQTEVNLSAWTHDQLYLDYFNSRLEEWEALHQDTTFTYDFQMISNAPEAYLQALAANEPVPDLLGLEQGQFPNFMKNGVIASNFLDLTDRIGADREKYAEGRFSIYSYEGRIFALESSFTESVYYYQPAVYEAAGVEVPTTLGRSPRHWRKISSSRQRV